MPPTQSSDPRDRMGIYKQLCDVPSEQRLKTYEDQYVGEQTYTQFLQTFYLERFNTKRSVEKVELAGRRWREHMETRGRHHALAMPSDVEEWVNVLLEKVSLNTAYNIYWAKLERFYTWLQRRIDHPHSYHPFLMAAAECPTASRVWDKKIERGRNY